MTLVTIGMPLYNQAQFLADGFASLLGQTHRDLEIVISDNASTDGTGAMCQELAARDPRVRYHRQEKNIGAVGNFFRVLDLARGDYFMWAAGHDAYAPEFAAKCAAVLDRRVEVGLVYPRARLVDLDGNPLWSEDYSEGLGTDKLGVVSRFNSVIWRSMYCTSIYGLFRTSALRRLRTRPQTMGWDKVVLAELSLYSVFIELPETLFFMRETRPQEDAATKAARQFTDVARREVATHARPQLEKVRSFVRMAAHADVNAQQRALLFPSLALCLGVKYGQAIMNELFPR